MSGPVGTVDASPTDAQASAVRPACGGHPEPGVAGRGHGVRRAPPRIGRRTVGAWCLADHLGPELVAGQVLHRDSLQPGSTVASVREET
jgi:hypothetical protein